MLKEVVLIVTLMMPGQQPDVRHMKPEPSLDACWAEAKEFADRDLSDALRKGGVLGMGATCAWHEKPSVEN